jgi:hypothetical protein
MFFAISDVPHEFLFFYSGVAQYCIESSSVKFLVKWNSNEANVIGQRDMTALLTQDPKAKPLRQYFDKIIARDYR